MSGNRSLRRSISSRRHCSMSAISFWSLSSMAKSLYWKGISGAFNRHFPFQATALLSLPLPRTTYQHLLLSFTHHHHHHPTLLHLLFQNYTQQHPTSTFLSGTCQNRSRITRLLSTSMVPRQN